MNIDLAAMRAMTGSHEDANLSAMLAALFAIGAKMGLDAPHRLAPLLGQVGEESGGFVYTREIWGSKPTAAQATYQGRMGNDQPGDGYRYRGGGLIETTGKDAYRSLTVWAQAHYQNAPDFVANPEAITGAPWCAVSALFYWDTHSCSHYCDFGDFIGLTKSINGGTNGLKERYGYACRAGLYLLGRDPSDVKGFQASAKITVDGDPEGETWGAMFPLLKALPPVSFGDVARSPQGAQQQASAPVPQSQPTGKPKGLWGQFLSAANSLNPWS